MPVSVTPVYLPCHLHFFSMSEKQFSFQDYCSFVTTPTSEIQAFVCDIPRAHKAYSLLLTILSPTPYILMSADILFPSGLAICFPH